MGGNFLRVYIYFKHFAEGVPGLYQIPRGVRGTGEGRRLPSESVRVLSFHPSAHMQGTQTPRGNPPEPRAHWGHSLEPDGRLLQVVDVEQPAEKDIQTGSKNKAGPSVNGFMNPGLGFSSSWTGFPCPSP